MSYHWLEDMDVFGLSGERLFKLTKKELIVHVIWKMKRVLAEYEQGIWEAREESARLAAASERLAAEVEELRYHVLDGAPSPLVERWRQGRASPPKWVPPSARRRSVT